MTLVWPDASASPKEPVITRIFNRKDSSQIFQKASMNLLRTVAYTLTVSKKLMGANALAPPYNDSPDMGLKNSITYFRKSHLC